MRAVARGRDSPCIAMHSNVDQLVAIFRRLSVSATALVAAFVFLFVAIWIPNLSFLRHVAVASDFTLSDKGRIFLTSFSALGTQFSVFESAVMVILALLFGVHLVLLITLLKKTRRMDRAGGVGMFGTLAGLLGIGCAACGSVLLSSVLGAGSAAAFLGVLPFRGAEFGVFGIATLLAANVVLLKRIARPPACRVSFSSDSKVQ